MGQARQRGTREERIATAKPKVRKPSAAQVNAEIKAAMVTGMMTIGAHIVGGTMAALGRRARSRGAPSEPGHEMHESASTAVPESTTELSAPPACLGEVAA